MKLNPPVRSGWIVASVTLLVAVAGTWLAPQLLNADGSRG